MRLRLLLLPLILASCGRDEVAVRGTLADPAAATEVWTAGNPERVAIENGAFELAVGPADTVDLHFATGERREARMHLEGVGGAGELRLDRIWFRGELALPGAVVTGGDRPVLINGLRLGTLARVPGEVKLSATVLAASEDGDALLVRPVDEALPDLRIAVTPASLVRTQDGDPIDAEDLEFGDSVGVSGLLQSGYVVATELTVQRRVASERDDRGEAAGEPDPDREARVAPAASAPAVTGGSAASGSAAPARVDRRGNEGPGRGKGEGKGKKKGRGKD